jgi:hypothetical protein
VKYKEYTGVCRAPTGPLSAVEVLTCGDFSVNIAYETEKREEMEEGKTERIKKTLENTKANAIKELKQRSEISKHKADKRLASWP